MRDHFVDSIKDDFRIIENIFTYSKGATGGGLHGWVTKFDFIISILEKNPGEYVLYSDIDIVFLKPCKDSLLELLKDNDIVFQREYEESGVNVGFIAMKSNEACLHFWKKAKEALLATGEWEQLLINKILNMPETDIRWSRLPSNYLNSTILQDNSLSESEIETKIWKRLIKPKIHRVPNIYKKDRKTIFTFADFRPLLNNSVYIYHANFAGYYDNSIELKLKNLSAVTSFSRKIGSKKVLSSRFLRYLLSLHYRACSFLNKLSL